MFTSREQINYYFLLWTFLSQYKYLIYMYCCSRFKADIFLQLIHGSNNSHEKLRRYNCVCFSCFTLYNYPILLLNMLFNCCKYLSTYSAFFLTVAIGNCMVKLIPPVNFCSDENIQTIFGTKLEDFLNYRRDYISIS
jgi:hypothetical protein